MAGKIVSMSEIESHLDAVQAMIDAARKQDNPTLNFGEIRKRAIALYLIVAPDDDDAGAGDSDPVAALITKADKRQAAGDAALVRKGAAAARRLKVAQTVAGSSAVAQIFPTLGQPIERRTIAQDEHAERVDIAAETQRRLERGDSVLDVFPSLKRFGVEG